MKHNFSISYRAKSANSPEWFNSTFEVAAKSLDDAMIELHELDETAEYITHDIDVNPEAYEPETDTIQSAIESRNK